MPRPPAERPAPGPPDQSSRLLGEVGVQHLLGRLAADALRVSEAYLGLLGLRQQTLRRRRVRVHLPRHAPAGTTVKIMQFSHWCRQRFDVDRHSRTLTSTSKFKPD